MWVNKAGNEVLPEELVVGDVPLSLWKRKIRYFAQDFAIWLHSDPVESGQHLLTKRLQFLPSSSKLFPVASFLQVSDQNSLCISHVSCMLRKPLFHHSGLCLFNHMCWRLHTMQVAIMQFPTCGCYSLSLRSKYSSQHSVLPLMRGANSHVRVNHQNIHFINTYVFIPT